MSNLKPSITYQQLLDNLHYDEKTGIFTYKIVSGKRYKTAVGAIAGNLQKNGVVSINFYGRTYPMASLAWLYITKELPPKGYIVDHIDGVASNNKWSNLRLATRSQNMYNTAKHSYKELPKGISASKMQNGKTYYYASLSANGKKVFGKSSYNLEELVLELNKARQLHHGEFAYNG